MNERNLKKEWKNTRALLVAILISFGLIVYWGVLRIVSSGHYLGGLTTSIILFFIAAFVVNLFVPKGVVVSKVYIVVLLLMMLIFAIFGIFPKVILEGLGVCSCDGIMWDAVEEGDAENAIGAVGQSGKDIFAFISVVLLGCILYVGSRLAYEQLKSRQNREEKFDDGSVKIDYDAKSILVSEGDHRLILLIEQVFANAKVEFSKRSSLGEVFPEDRNMTFVVGSSGSKEFQLLVQELQNVLARTLNGRNNE